MLSGRENISHYNKSNVLVWMIMAFQAGALNTGGLMACHTFVSHVTGFATLVGMSIGSEQNWHDAFRLLTIPLFFLIGSALSGVFVDLKIHTGRRPQYFMAFGAIFIILLSVTIGSQMQLFGVFGESLHLVRDYAFIGFLCLACGLQNGTITSVSRAVVRTTHLTGITTDLGIGIIRVLNHRKYPSKWPDEEKANLMRVGMISFFILGSAISAYGYSHFQYLGFILPLMTSAYLFALFSYVQFYKHKVQH